MNNNPKRRRLHLPSLAPHRNADDHTASSSSTDRRCNNKNNNNDDENNEEHTANDSIGGKSSSDQVLRYGETIASLFCLDLIIINNNIDKDGHDVESLSLRRHEELCESIVHSKADDAAVWNEVLLYTLRRTSHHHQQHINNINNMNNKDVKSAVGKRLIGLHRRATSRFKYNHNNNNNETMSLLNNQHDDILKLWLSYALTLLIYDSTNTTTNNNTTNSASTTATATAISSNAIHTYKHIQRMFYTDESKEFYRALFNHEELNDDVLSKLRNEVLLSSSSSSSSVGMDTVLERQWRALETGGMLHYCPSTFGGGMMKKKKLTLPSLNGKTSKETVSSNDGGDDDSADKSTKTVKDDELLDSRMMNNAQDGDESIVSMSSKTTTTTMPLVDPLKKNASSE
eukprot:scaffold20363_cov23-Cyclotella_meneghiniana.AAC.4